MLEKKTENIRTNGKKCGNMFYANFGSDYELVKILLLLILIVVPSKNS